jgi:hypothetical protein
MDMDTLIIDMGVSISKDVETEKIMDKIINLMATNDIEATFDVVDRVTCDSVASLLSFPDDPHEYSQKLDMEKLKDEAQAKLAELLEIVVKLNGVDPPMDELGWETNEREVVQFSKMAACKIMKAANCYGYSGCILCGS